MPGAEQCKAKLDLGGEASPANFERVLAQAKALGTRCECSAVTIVLKRKDGYSTVSIGCLRGRRKKAEPG